MATARLITAEIYDFVQPPRQFTTASDGVAGRLGTSVIKRTGTALSLGHRGAYGSSTQLGITTLVVQFDPLVTAMYPDFVLQTEVL